MLTQRSNGLDFMLKWHSKIE